MLPDAAVALIVVSLGVSLYDSITLGVAIIGLLVGVISAFFAYQALLPYRRNIIEGVDSKNVLLAPDAPGLIEVFYAGERITAPYLLEYRLRCQGRSDIKSEDFDQNRPIVVKFAKPIVADLTPLPRIDFMVKHGKLHVGPTLLKRGRSYVFTLLFDGDPLLPTVTDNLSNIRLTNRDSWQRIYRRRSVYAYLAALACVLVGLSLKFGIFSQPNTAASLVLLASAYGPVFLGLVFTAQRASDLRKSLGATTVDVLTSSPASSRK